MRVAYLVNQYPHISHAFIRREIAGLERLGIHVRRFTIRPPPADLLDADDIAEARRTEVLLRGPVAGLAAGAALHLAAHAGAGLSALGQAARMGVRAERGHLRYLAYFAEATRLLERLRRDRVEHLHAHFGTNSATVACLTRALGGPPFSFTVHGPEEFDATGSLSLADKIRAAAFVVAVSDFGKSQLCRLTSPDHWGKIHVVHCGVDERYLDQAEPPPPPDGNELVCVARLSEQKGHMYLLEAARVLADEGLPFTVRLCGDGPLRGLLEQRIAQLRLQDRVRLMGWMDGRAVREAVVAARGMVLPSFAEGLPVVFMEALALRRPVVATWVAGIPELVQHGVSGWLVPPASVPDLADAMRLLLRASPGELAWMGAAGAARVRERHDARREAERLVAAFRGTTPPPRRSPEPPARADARVTSGDN